MLSFWWTSLHHIGHATVGRTDWRAPVEWARIACILLQNLIGIQYRIWLNIDLIVYQYVFDILVTIDILISSDLVICF